MTNPWYDAITDVPGILVGHATNRDAGTGCSVVICPEGTVGGVDQRGGAPGTRETDLLRPMQLVQHVHAVLFAGGSAFGLDAATGVVRWLEERGIGYDTGFARVPIVPAAILYDLAVGRSDVRPDATMGYAACEVAASGEVVEGRVGAGTGCTVGKVFGPQSATPAGLGTASVNLGGGLVVAALVAVNAFGDVIDPRSGAVVAGPANTTGVGFADTLMVMRDFWSMASSAGNGIGNTVIGAVGTSARLSKEGANKVAQMAHDGLARAVRPAHTMYDGDTIFALGTGQVEADVSLVGAFAAEVMAEAIVRAVSLGQDTAPSEG